MIQTALNAKYTCNIPHSEAVKANDRKAWVGTHEKFHNTCQTHSGKSKTTQSRDLAKILQFPKKVSNPETPKKWFAITPSF